MSQQRRPTRRGIATSTGAALCLAILCAQVTSAGADLSSARTHSPGLSPAPTAAARTAPLAWTAPLALAAHVQSVNDTGNLHLLNASGSILSEEGPVSGSLPGRTKVRLVVGENVSATFTITSRGGGSIEGHGSAVLHSSGRYSSFGGTLTVKHGTGRYAHAHGSGKLYGVIDRRTDNLTVQTTGTLDY